MHNISFTEQNSYEKILFILYHIKAFFIPLGF